MAIASDLDWVILLGAATFLLFGTKSRETMRTLGRWYGRAMRMKQEMLAEVAKAAEIPLPASGGPLGLRSVFLGVEPSVISGIPAAVSIPTTPIAAPLPPIGGLWSSAPPVPTWSIALPAVPGEGEVGPRC